MTKPIKEYKTEELKQILILTKANILDYTELIQGESRNRQIIEKELVERQKEGSKGLVKEALKDAQDAIAGKPLSQKELKEAQDNHQKEIKDAQEGKEDTPETNINTPQIT